MPGALAALLWPCAGVLRAEVDYLHDVKPVLKARCFACHGALKQEANLRLDRVANMRKGSDSGDVIDPDGSILLQRVTAGEDERMPPEGAPLSADEIASIKKWLASGATAPSDEQPEIDPRQHWAYQLPQRAAGGIDALLAARQAAKGLQPQGEAAPEIWLRRVYFDLLGLPPTTAELNAFLAFLSVNGRDEAYRAVVDRLLASPAYGERWGRHFMDIWRYSDWYGLGAELRNSQKHIWHWRDWIVESLNADKPYDRMVVEMCGVEISDWFPHIVSCADEIAFIRSMWTTDNNHGAQNQFAAGRHRLEPKSPTLGAWVTYGLSSMTDEVPARRRCSCAKWMRSTTRPTAA